MIDKFIQEIEAGDLRHDLAFANTPRTLMHRIHASKIVNEAQKRLRYDLGAVQKVLERAVEIYTGPFERGYLHPDDLILATYIYLLRHSPLASVQSLVRAVAGGKYPEFRGARGVAKIVAERMMETSSYSSAPRSVYLPVLHQRCRRKVTTSTRSTTYSAKLIPNSVEESERYLEYLSDSENYVGVA